MGMGSLGFSEILFILLLALLLFGPDRLPELGRMVGRALAEFRRASTDLRATIDDEIQSLERQAALEPPASPSPSISPPAPADDTKTPRSS